MRTQTRTQDSVLKQIADLDNLSYGELCELWKTLFDKEPTASNKPYLIKRLAYRIQEIAYGGLSEGARNAMDRILTDHGYNEYGGSDETRRKRKKRMNGMPIPGTRLIRTWNGRTYEVIVTAAGFEYEGMFYKSLTAIVKDITGSHWNGRSFFGLQPIRKMREKRPEDE